eukprot:CAMPEP_0194261544 /NCGR_PEP_ID=MMETSP0158-20130606/46081_1 /TAXON_ID=33649 /ORGANISM="Thalassionema nitzschioides, Strain L26-B" /LENGTH=636 /DNA_ID=CAMNT_0039001667 /DNA_START=1 /DNA_END=1908 /DNA_ORIENTATION=+
MADDQLLFTIDDDTSDEDLLIVTQSISLDDDNNNNNNISMTDIPITPQNQQVDAPLSPTNSSSSQQEEPSNNSPDRVRVRNILELALPSGQQSLGLVFTNKTLPIQLKAIKPTSPLIHCPDLQVGMTVDALTLSTTPTTTTTTDLADKSNGNNGSTNNKSINNNKKKTYHPKSGHELVALLQQSYEQEGRKLRLLIPEKEEIQKQDDTNTNNAEVAVDLNTMCNDWMNTSIGQLFGIQPHNYTTTTTNQQQQQFQRPPGGGIFGRSERYMTTTTFSAEVKEELERIINQETNKSIYLSKKNHQQPRTIFRDSITLGSTVLGSGNFCDVVPVTALTNYKEINPNICGGLTSMVVKHVKPSITDKEEFLKAASELWMEAKYLATLNGGRHDHILRSHALIVPSQSTLRNHSLGILMDRMDETLSDRMKKKYYYLRKKQQQSSSSSSKALLFDKCCSTMQQQQQQQHDNSTKLERLVLLQQLASALAYLHKQGLVYRDVKPDNVGLLQNNVKLMDFGLLAEFPSSENGTNDTVFLTQRCGTLRYMAPDVCLGRYNESADVYSFSVLLWELWYLQGPFLQRYDKDLDHVKAILAGTREDCVEPNYYDDDDSDDDGDDEDADASTTVDSVVANLITSGWNG